MQTFTETNGKQGICFLKPSRREKGSESSLLLAGVMASYYSILSVALPYSQTPSSIRLGICEGFLSLSELDDAVLVL